VGRMRHISTSSWLPLATCSAFGKRGNCAASDPLVRRKEVQVRAVRGTSAALRERLGEAHHICTMGNRATLTFFGWPCNHGGVTLATRDGTFGSACSNGSLPDGRAS
jgi:hypothetical protein